MSLFDLFFLAASAAAFVTVVVTIGLVIAGRRRRAVRVLRVLGTCTVVYIAAGLGVSLVRPQRVINVGDPWCFDDWCLKVDTVSKTAQPTLVTYRVEMRVFSRARRVAQAARGAWLYLIDEHGKRYAPDAAPSETPLDVRLQPMQSVTTTRVFQVPAGVQIVGLVTGHGGPYCGPMDILVIGESGCVFNKPTMIRIQ